MPIEHIHKPYIWLTARPLSNRLIHLLLANPNIDIKSALLLAHSQLAAVSLSPLQLPLLLLRDLQLLRILGDEFECLLLGPFWLGAGVGGDGSRHVDYFR